MPEFNFMWLLTLNVPSTKIADNIWWARPMRFVLFQAHRIYYIGESKRIVQNTFHSLISSTHSVDIIGSHIAISCDTDCYFCSLLLYVCIHCLWYTFCIWMKHNINLGQKKGWKMCFAFIVFAITFRMRSFHIIMR